MNTQTENKLGCRRKRYGWGWYPAGWQGWTVIAVYLALVLVGAFLWEGQTLRLGIMLAVLSVALVTLSYIKGETPRWQWGGEKKAAKDEDKLEAHK